RLEAKVREGKAFAAISARVSSLTPLSRVAVQVMRRPGEVEESPGHDARWEPAGDAWAVSGEVPLAPGENTIVVQAWNEDGESPAAQVQAFYQKPDEPRPDVLVESALKAQVD